MKYLLTISYDGRNYCGYQKQKNGVSIQEKLTDAAKVLFGEGTKITGCSRTDSGVHAVAFKATLESENAKIKPEKLPSALNAHLPPDISVRDATEVDNDFHPRYSVKEKEYRYVICNASTRDPFLDGRAYFFPKKLDAEIMNEAAQYLVGKHDFKAFMASGSKIEDTVREIYSCSVTREGDNITVSVRGNGFLYNMVRIIVGTLIAVSDGKIEKTDIAKIVESKDRKNAGPTAPAEGLYLYDVKY